MSRVNKPFRRAFTGLSVVLLFALVFQASPLPLASQSRLVRLATSTTKSAVKASFSYSPAIPTVGAAVQFTDTSSGNVTSWRWDFGDGTTSAAQHPSHAYAASGFKKVILIVGSGSATKKTSRTISVLPATEAATFVFNPTTPGPGQTVQFTDTSSGNPTSWRWSFGDGGSSTSKNPSHAYHSVGSYTVTLVSTGNNGSKQGSRSLSVASVSTLASSFTFSPSLPAAGQAVQFTDASTGTPTAWSWSFGDGTTSTAQNPSHTYATAGTKTVTLTVSNGTSSNSASRTVTVAVALAASFSFSPASPAAGQAVQFTDASTGTPTAWSWSFGDGTTSTAQNPSHTYAAAGSYSVGLTVTNASSQASGTRTVTVTAAAALSAGFSFTPSSPAPGRAVQFTDASTGTPTAWSWSFGDGTTSTAQNPSHTYTVEGAYTVALVASNSSSSDTETRTISVAASDLLTDDRVIDWTYAGVPGGIPERTTIVATLGPGATAAQISAAVAAASGSEGVVLLTAGTYSLDATVSLGAASGVTLRGAGAGKTIIRSTSSGTEAISSNPRTYIDPAISGGTSVASGYGKGSTSITLASTPPSTFRAGNMIQIVQNDDYILVFHRTGNWAGTRNLRHTSRITGVSGNVVTFATPIPYGFSAAYQPQANAMAPGAVRVGIEDLTVVANSSGAITFGGADRCWVKGVETSNTGNGAIEFRASSQCEIRRCYVHDASGYPSQSDGYGIFLFYGTCYCRIEDNVGRRMANLVMMNGASGNAILYNYVRSGARDGLSWITPSFHSNHGPHGLMNLFEGNVIASFQNDGYHGSTSHGLLVRNQISGIDADSGWTMERRLVDLCRGSYYHTVIGNVIGDASWTPNYYELSGSPGHSANACIYILGYPNMGNTSLTAETAWENFTATYPDRKVSDTLVRHGNYDYYNKGVVWDDNISSRVIPDSLIYASKPAYFGALSWPAIGPDVNGLVGGIPAKLRFDAYALSGNLDDLLQD